MTLIAPLLRLHDVDLLIEEALAARAAPRLRRLGLDLGDPQVLEQRRTRLATTVDPRLLAVYERARRRYGRGLATVRDRVCTGCFVTLPTSASPREGGSSLRPCESCGRLLYWR
jgi:hypothetical protein